MKYSKTIAMGVVSILSLTLPVFSADWPLWRNAASNSGASSETILLPLVPQWHSSAPSVEENGAVVANGIAYMSTDDGWLYAFDVLTGFVVPGYPVATAPSYGTPSVDATNNIVYVLAAGNLFALNLNGTMAWAAPVGATGQNYNQGPVVDDGYVYVHAGDLLQKFDAAGALQWLSPAAGIDLQASVMGDHVYINTGVGGILKFDKLTGAEVVGGGFPIATLPSNAALTTVNGRIFHKAADLYVYDASNGALVWSAPAGGDSIYYGSPAVAGGAVYVYGWDGRLYALDENTGATLPGFPSVALAAPGDRNYNSPAVAGDKVFVGAGTTQKLKVLGAAGTPQAGLVLAEYSTFSTDPQGFDLCSAIVSDGWVLIMLDGGGLYAFFGGQGNPPTGALSINGGDACTESQIVALTLDNNDNPEVVEMMVSEDPFLSGASWQPYAETSPWMLSAGFGLKTVYAQLRDVNGLLSVVFTAQIDYRESCGTNRPPVAVAMVDGQEAVTVEQASHAGTAVTLDGTLSTDPDDDLLIYEWDFESDGTFDASGAVVVNTYNRGGPYTATLRVTDPDGLSATDTVEISVIDTTPPVIENITVTPATLWPVNHMMVPIGINATLSDICDPAPVLAIVGVTCNEPTNGRGDGNTAPDWSITGALDLMLRAERAGPRNSRIYTIEFVCTDAAGNTTAATATVEVPHDQSLKKKK